MFRTTLKAGLRNFWKNKSYSFLNIFGLTIGIACAGLIFLIRAAVVKPIRSLRSE